MNIVILTWRDSLGRLLRYYEARRGQIRTFYPKLFLFFILLNIVCYWLAILTAYPKLVRGAQGFHYFQIQFPVGFLGALFDSLSFFVTVWIVRRALRTQSSMEYVGHLMLDVVIAILATFWVLLVFTISGWLISVVDSRPMQELVLRQERYQDLVVRAVEQPRQNFRNIYFGLVMGISASLPTFIHIFMFIRAVLGVLFAFGNRRKRRAA